MATATGKGNHCALSHSARAKASCENVKNSFRPLKRGSRTSEPNKKTWTYLQHPSLFLRRLVSAQDLLTQTWKTNWEWHRYHCHLTSDISPRRSSPSHRIRSHRYRVSFFFFPPLRWDCWVEAVLWILCDGHTCRWSCVRTPLERSS